LSIFVKFGTKTSTTMLKQAALDSGCVGFEPQQWRQERCKRCFRLQSQHDQQLLLNDDRQLDDEADQKLLTTAAADRSKIYRRHSWRSTPATLGQISTTTKSPTDAAVVPDVSESTTKSSQRYGSASSLNTECLNRWVGWWWWWWWLIVTWDNVELEWREKRYRRMPHRRTMGKRFPRPFTLCCSARKTGKGNSESCQSPYVPSLDVDPMSRTVSYESVASTLCDVSSMVTAQSRASVNSERSSTPTESLDETRLYLRSMRSQLEIVENKCARLEEENANLRKNVRECSAAAAAAAAGATTTTTTTTTSTVVVGEGDATRALQERLALLEGLYEDYRDENLALKSELRDAHESTAKQANAEAKLLKEKLLSMEAICEELMGENDKLKQEMLNLQQEIDEMHDQYREEEIDEFRELQRELEQTAKNCRILQFKLRKAERRNDQSEADRHRLEQQLHEILSQQQQQSGVGVSALRSDAASPLFDLSRRRDLEAELRIAKEVSVRLHNELEMLEEKRCKYEDENFYLKERIREMEAREKIIEQTHLRHHEQRRVFGSAGKLNNDPTAVAATQCDNNGSATVSSTDNGENGRLISGVAATADGINFGQLLRDFQDSLERETDLKEQLKFAEDDLLSVRQKVADLETENEVMMRQLAKLSCEDKRNSSGSGGSSGGSRPPMTRSYSEGHTQIELELAEHEAEVLKTRLRRTERDNDKLIARVALLEKELQKLGAGNREFSEEELFASVPDTYYKQKAKLLEEELEELRSRFENSNAESDQIYTAEKRKQELPHHQHAVEGDGSSLAVGKNNNNNNSLLPGGHSTGTSSTSVDVNRQMRLIEEELEVLRDRNNMLEKENDRLSSEIRKLYLISSTAATRANSNTINNAQMTTTSVVDKAADCGANLKMAERFSQMEKDIHRFIGRISELEQEKELLVKDLERRKRLDNIKKEESQLMNEHLRTVHVGTASVGELRERVTELLKENVVLTYELQVERRKNREMESLLDDYKEMISTPPAKSGRIACKKTTEDKASETVRPRLEQLSNYARFIADFDAEMGLLCVEFDQLVSQSHTFKERKLSMPLRSSSQTSSYAESVDQEKHLDPEVKILKQRLKTLKSRLEEECKLISSSKPAELFEQSQNSQEHEISKLRDQLYLMNAEKCSVQKKFEAGTVRLLQTEERLKKELERVKENYENQVNDLKRRLQDSERLGQENACTVKELEMMLGEKCSHAQELESKLKQIESDTRQRCRELQEKAESDRRRVKEFEIKYQTLESLHDTDQSRWSLEREKLNNDLCELKKRYEEIQADLESCKESADRKQSTWNRQKADYENRLKQLQAELSDIDRRTAKRAADLASAESQKLVAQLEQMKRQADLEKEALLADKVDLEHKLSQVNKEMINQAEHLERLKEELALMKSRVGEQKQQLQDTRKQRDDFREQLGRLQQSWTRERGELVHKLRQEEKIQQAEQQALRLKYESRIKVMEDSVKRNQSQLSVARHERENFKQNTVSLEKKIVDLIAKHQEEIHALKSQLDILRKQNDEVESIKLQLSQKSVELEQLLGTAKTERDLWLIERKHLESKIKQSSTKSTLKNCSEINFEKEKMLTDAIEIAGKIRIQMDDLKNSHDKKINQLKESLKSQRQEWNKERQDINRKLKEAEDQLRILNIDYQNLMSKESAHENEKTTLQMEKDALITHIQDVEIRTLANKYKLDRISDHMIDVEAKLNNNNSDKLTTDHLDQRDVESAQQLIRTICLQLKNIRDDMAKVKELGKAVPNLELLTTHSTNKDRIKYDDALLLVDFQPNQTNNGANTAAGERLISDPAVAKNSTKSAFCRTASSESNYNFSTLHRLRSPSPSPRKITNYPEAPPSIIINTKKAIEYDKDGRRHWVRRSMCRSVSLDPTPVSKNPLVLTSASDLPPPSGSTQHPRSNSAGSDMIFRVKPKAAVSITATDSEIRPDNWTQSCSAAVKPQMQKSREKIANLFSNLGREKGGSRVREKRRIFEGSRTSSVESSETGQMIGSLGMQTCLVGASSDIENILHNKKSGERNLPPRQARSSSATRLLQRLRGRSTSRDTPRSAFTETTASSSQKADDAASDRVAAGCFHTHNMKKRKNKPKAAAAPAYCNISTSEEQSQTTSNDDCYNKVINNKDTTTISLGDTESRALSSVNRSRPRSRETFSNLKTQLPFSK
ncbi:Protein SOGA2, partial [Trichinella sp. T9]